MPISIVAVEGAIASKFRNGGQTCVCANRILVQSGIYDAFAAKLAGRVATMKVGPGTEDGVEIGPMINPAAIEKIERHVADALDKGARIIAQSEAVPEGSQYARPAVLGEATTEMLLASEETFGPVAPLFRFETEEEAITIANGTPFGLAAYFYTENLKRSWRVAEALEFGMVGLNTGLISTEVAPFGGVKQSGLGREGSQVGVEEYLEVKALHVGALNWRPGGSETAATKAVIEKGAVEPPLSRWTMRHCRQQQRLCHAIFRTGSRPTAAARPPTSLISVYS